MTSACEEMQLRQETSKMASMSDNELHTSSGMGVASPQWDRVLNCFRDDCVAVKGSRNMNTVAVLIQQCR